MYFFRLQKYTLNKGILSSLNTKENNYSNRWQLWTFSENVFLSHFFFIFHRLAIFVLSIDSAAARSVFPAL